MVLCIAQQMTRRGVVEAVIFPGRVVAGADKKNLVVLGIVVADVPRIWAGRVEVIIV